MTGSRTLRSSVVTKTSLLAFSARPIHGAASAVTLAPTALSRSRLRIIVSSRVGVARVGLAKGGHPHRRAIVLYVRARLFFMSEHALHVFRSTLVLLRPDVHQILYPEGVLAGRHGHTMPLAEGDVFALDGILRAVGRYAALQEPCKRRHR